MLFEINRVCDTIITTLESQRPFFDTLINYYYDGRHLTIYKGARASIPLSDCPSIEVYAASSTPSWFACRTLQDEMTLQIDITTEHTDRSTAVDLEGKLVTLVGRILTRPPTLRTQIQGTPYTLLDSLPGSVQYGGMDRAGVVRVARMTWSGKALEYLQQSLFSVPLPGPENSSCG